MGQVVTDGKALTDRSGAVKRPVIESLKRYKLGGMPQPQLEPYESFIRMFQGIGEVKDDPNKVNLMFNEQKLVKEIDEV